MKEISKIIQDKLTSIGNSEKAIWLENYVKHEIKSKGVGIPEIRKVVREMNDNYSISGKPVSIQFELLNDLMSQEYTEDKLAAILYIQIFHKNKNHEEIVSYISEWFDSGFISDWNLCDWLCVRILTPMFDNRNSDLVDEFRKWNKTGNLWKARASLVPFVQFRNIALYRKIIWEFSAELIKRDERFCKTAVGWVLREYSKIDVAFVNSFLTEFKNWTTKEVINNATKNFKKT